MSLEETWPGVEHRRPPRSSPTYAIRAPLAAWLREQAGAVGADVRVLDVGCGIKPYYPLFAGVAREYVGVDVDNPAADLSGSAEQLPVPDASFDVVLCTQVLEHSEDPARAVRELRRAVAPGGRVLASTHGVQVYHPSPADHWRWTHTGLERLFRDNGDWQSVSVRAASGTASCIGMLLSMYVDLFARRIRVGGAGRLAVRALNGAGAALDRRSALLREPRPGALIANYHVVAEPPGG